MTTEAVPQVPAADQAGKPKRMSATIFDMVRSLGVLVIVVAVTLVFVPGLLHPSKSQRYQPVPYSDDTQGFQQVTGLPPLVPTGLDKPWYANSASLKYGSKTAHLHIGWVTPTNEYAALEESNTSSSAFIQAELGERGLKTVGAQLIGGLSWAQRVSEQGERSLTCTTGAITVVITGSASQPQLDQLAGALHIRPSA
jgi:hypothetical protein